MQISFVIDFNFQHVNHILLPKKYLEKINKLKKKANKNVW